jgi:UDP-N-acetylmuramoyl-tripeptide--D-alanyl-D-alanine ligase
VHTIDDPHQTTKQHRSRLRNIRFIGITGSCGKTTTKQLATYLLKPDFRGRSSPDDSNCGRRLIDHLLRVESEDRFCIQELGAWGTGTLDLGLELVRPDIGVVLNVRNDHYSKFKGLEKTQAEKSKVVQGLPLDGVAILNTDDHLTWEMRHGTKAKVIGFGTQRDADFRAEHVYAAWPERLSFDLFHQGTHQKVITQLLGEHLVGSALAALAIATTIGLPLETALARIAGAPPSDRRLSPTILASGVTFIRDDFKAPSDSKSEVAQFLSQARARRKIAVLGRISDHPGRSRPVYTAYASAIAKVVNLLVLVGERAEDLWGRHRRDSADFLAEFKSFGAEVRLFETVEAASENLRDELRPDDLVFLKGSGVADHLERILLQFQSPVRCWETNCRRTIACDICEKRDQAPHP